jgi:hypothetical protein
VEPVDGEAEFVVAFALRRLLFAEGDFLFGRFRQLAAQFDFRRTEVDLALEMSARSLASRVFGAHAVGPDAGPEAGAGDIEGSDMVVWAAVAVETGAVANIVGNLLAAVREQRDVVNAETLITG